jgi:hypothetical protein
VDSKGSDILAVAARCVQKTSAEEVLLVRLSVQCDPNGRCHIHDFVSRAGVEHILPGVKAAVPIDILELQIDAWWLVVERWCV